MTRKSKNRAQDLSFRSHADSANLPAHAADIRFSRREAGIKLLAGGVAVASTVLLGTRAAHGAEEDTPTTPRLIDKPDDMTKVTPAGVLCEANGPAQGADRVWAWVYQDDDDEPGAFPPTGAYFTTPNTMGKWVLDGILPGAVAGMQNHIKVWYESYGPQGPVITDIDEKTFTPVSGSCAPGFPVPISPPIGGQSSEEKAFPIRRVDYPGMGTLLMKSDTEPLRAKWIKVWASSVDWLDDMGKPHQKPTGNDDDGAHGWWHPSKKAKQYAILVWQPARNGASKPRLRVVRATNKGKAKEFNVSATRDIFIQVNGRRDPGNTAHKKHKLAADDKPLMINVEFEAP